MVWYIVGFNIHCLKPVCSQQLRFLVMHQAQLLESFCKQMSEII